MSLDTSTASLEKYQADVWPFILTEPYTGHVHQEVVKELPDMVGRVDLLHFYLSVHIAVIHKVHIGSFHLGIKKEEIYFNRILNRFWTFFCFCHIFTLCGLIFHRNIKSCTSTESGQAWQEKEVTQCLLCIAPKLQCSKLQKEKLNLGFLRFFNSQKLKK